jgi:hypothetical protein
MLRKVLELKLPMREEIEVLFVKVALKPVIELEHRIKPKKEETKEPADLRKSVELPLILDEHDEG